jgi:hypothetical protein
MSDIEGKAASECGQRASFNEAIGMSDPAAAGLRGKQRASVGNERVSTGHGRWLRYSSRLKLRTIHSIICL